MVRLITCLERGRDLAGRPAGMSRAQNNWGFSHERALTASRLPGRAPGPLLGASQLL